MLLLNPAPPVARVDGGSGAGKPYVVKIHARWCPVCMMTKGVWDEVASAYSGRVNLVVFDVTDVEATASARAEAGRLGLSAFFEEYSGATGTVHVLRGSDKAVVGSIEGSRRFADYRAAIESALP